MNIKCTITALPIYNHTIGKIDMKDANTIEIQYW